MTIPTGSTAITDPNDPTKQASVGSDGALKVAATFSAASVAINDANTTSNTLAIDSNGKIGISSMPSVTASNPSVGTDGSAIPTSSTLIGASDGVNLQQLTVESSSNRNLRTSLYNGANEASVSAGGALKVDNSAVTQPISAASLPLPSGAATAAKQPALGTAGSASTDVLTVQGIASMTAIKTDGSGVTQPVSAASLPLPTGAATAAKQPALGTAGTASTDVLTVQGIASMTALNVSQQASGSVSATLQNAQNGNANGSTLNVLGMSSCTWVVNMSGFTGTVNFEASSDGTNYNSITLVQLGTSTLTTTATGSTTTSITTYEGSVGALQLIRARTSGVSAGTVTVTAVATPVPFSPRTINSNLVAVASALSQSNQLPVSNAAPQGKLTISGSLSANSDNSLTFSGGATVARRIRIQNESSGVIYWETDATASAGSPSLAAPAANAVSAEWIAVQCTTLHIFIPSGGTTTLNGSGGVKVTAYA